ncbi:MAG: hypothetical protein ACRDD3_09615 [Azovibrio sp.]
MITNDRKIMVLQHVAEGGTIKEAGAAAFISAGRASQLLANLCRELKLSSSLADIRTDPKKYLTRLEEFKHRPQFELRKSLVHDLIFKLKLKSEDDLTPKYVANISASQMLNSGVTLLAVTEIQEWLSKRGLSLKRRPPETNKELTEVKRAIAVLDVYHFDTAFLRKQLQNLEGEND